MLQSEIIAVCSQIHAKHINTLCRQNVRSALYTTVTLPYNWHFQTRVQKCQNRLLPLSHQSVRLSVRMEPPDYHWKDFLVILNLSAFQNFCRTFKFLRNSTTINSTLYTDRYTFLIISHSFLLRIRNVSNRNCEEN
jgi:hypothetical protein